MKRAYGCAVGVGLLILLAPARMATAMSWDHFNGEEYEEPSGGYWLLESEVRGKGGGLGAGSGAWIRDTPVCADYFAELLWNRLEDAIYGTLGITLRLMPHWTVAPFAGVGGTYNAVVSRELETTYTTEDEEIKGKDYWGGHAEAGLRVKIAAGFCELLGRYTWTNSKIEKPDYGTVRLGWSMSF